MKKNIILSAAVVVAAIISLFGIYMKQSKIVNTDSIKFKEEYESLNGKENDNGKEYLNVSVDSSNPIVYSSFQEISDVIEKGTGIIYFGFPECPWCRNAVPVLLDAAKELNVNKIYYFNALSIRDKKHLDDNGNIITDEEGTEEYKKLIEILYDQLPSYEGLNDDSIKRLYFPTVLFVKDGKIIGIYTSTVDSQKDPYVKLNDEQYSELKNIYLDLINKTYDILCDQSC